MALEGSCLAFWASVPVDRIQVLRNGAKSIDRGLAGVRWSAQGHLSNQTSANAL